MKHNEKLIDRFRLEVWHEQKCYIYFSTKIYFVFTLPRSFEYSNLEFLLGKYRKIILILISISRRSVFSWTPGHFSYFIVDICILRSSKPLETVKNVIIIMETFWLDNTGPSTWTLYFTRKHKGHNSFLSAVSRRPWHFLYQHKVQ